MTTYAYDIDNDFSDGVVQNKLHDEVEDSSISTEFVGVITEEADGECKFEFGSELSSSEQDTLDTVVADHDGQPYPFNTHLTSVTLLDGETEVTSTDAYEKVGAVVANPGFFEDPSDVAAKIVGRIKLADGETVDVRLVEDADGVETELGTMTITGTGSWETLDYLTTAEPSSGKNLYRFEAKLDTASSATFCHVVASLVV